MQNPFETIEQRLEGIESLLEDIKSSNQRPNHTVSQQKEKIDRKEFSERYKLSYGKIHKLMRSGELPYSKIGRRTLFAVEDVEALFEAHKRKIDNE